MPENESLPFGRNTCHICGGTDFTWGKFGNPIYTKIIPESRSAFVAWFLSEELTPRPRICKTCGNVQLFVGQSDK